MKNDVERKLLASLMIMGSVVEARDAYTGGHLWRVAQYARLLAQKLGLSDHEVFLASIGGFLHDLGKVGVPDAILNKPGRLDDAEIAIARQHPLIGRQVMVEHPLAPMVLDAMTYHHERADGAGYPERLAGEDIPRVARMVAIADSFDAMTSTRSYRKGLPVERAFGILTEERGRQFDAQLVDHFLELGRAGKLEDILGHTHHGRRLVSCPGCGPVMVAPSSDADGTVVPCRACGGEFRLHQKGDSFELEFTGRLVPVATATPLPDLDAVQECVCLAA